MISEKQVNLSKKGVVIELSIVKSFKICMCAALLLLNIEAHSIYVYICYMLSQN